MRKRNITYTDRYLLAVALISISVALLIHFPEMISLFDRYEQFTLFPFLEPQQVVFEVIFTFLSLLVLFAVNTFIFKFNRTSTRIYWWQIILSFLLTWALSNLLGQFFVNLHHHYDVPAIDAMVHHYLHPLRDFIITCVVTGSSYMIHLLRQKQLVQVENQQLQAESILNQYEALKNQLNPHMLFNSLNTLRSLVREAPEKAQEYIQELSRVLRYTLQGSDAQGVTLKEEMEFVQAYTFLMKMRYEDNLTFETRIDSHFETFFLPHMAVQMLIENAVKHNEISTRKPLVITVSIDEEGWLTVSNKIQSKLTATSGTGIGLVNLNKRYQLLFKREIQILDDKVYFAVRIPLISRSLFSAT